MGTMHEPLTQWENFVNIAKIVAKRNLLPLLVTMDSKGTPHALRLQKEETYANAAPNLRPGEFYINEFGDSYEKLPGLAIPHRTIFTTTTRAQNPPAVLV